MSNLPKRFCMVGVRYFVHDKWLIFNMVLKLWADVKYHVPTGLVFRRRRAVFILLAMPPTSLGRAALVMWCGWFKPWLEIRHATALTTSAKHWHRHKDVFYVFVSVPPTNCVVVFWAVLVISLFFSKFVKTIIHITYNSHALWHRNRKKYTTSQNQ